MKAFYKSIVLAGAIAALSACKELKIENGEIPAEYLSVAQQFAGDYNGRFENNHGVLHLKLEGNKLQATFTGANGETDLIGAGCHSQVGNLLRVGLQGKDENTKVKYARFAFTAGDCRNNVQGQTFDVRVGYHKDSVRLEAEVFEINDFVYRCGIRDGNRHDRDDDYSGRPTYPGRSCGWETVDYYLTGSFTKN